MTSKVINDPKIKYSVKNDIQHVLDCSDVYIGDTGSNMRKEFVFSDEHNKIISQNVDVPETLIRIFVEVLTNAVDNVERSKDIMACKNIKVNLNLETGITSVWNDGCVIPIIQNKKQNNNNGLSKEEFKLLSEEERSTIKKFNELYIHSLIFGQFRSSSNYGNEEVREVSGKNGVGVKCTNIFSSYFCVTGVDPDQKLKLTQEWTNNMTKTTEPKIRCCSTNGYTEVKYIPDFKRFKLTKYPPEMYGLLKKMVIDISSLLPEINVYFNGEKFKLVESTLLR
jgi:DNA topoisomerase-2